MARLCGPCRNRAALRVGLDRAALRPLRAVCRRAFARARLCEGRAARRRASLPRAQPARRLDDPRAPRHRGACFAHRLALGYGSLLGRGMGPGGARGARQRCDRARRFARRWRRVHELAPAREPRLRHAERREAPARARGHCVDPMDIRGGFVGAIGNTPLIRLRGPSELTGCEILGKAEFLNPGGSVKDRAGLYLILDAEKRGLLKPGGLIVEGTAGNTGSGLTVVGNARGYKTLIVIPSTQSQEKKDMLLLCGAQLMEVAAVPYKDPNNYVHISERVAR